MSTPSFLLSSQGSEPIVTMRQFNGRSLPVWHGRVKIDSIQGWLENPRIEIAKKKYLAIVGNRDLTQDEIYTLMKNEDEVKLKDLRDDILKNGLREPLTLSFNGKLLDGNRRFFAIKFALEGMKNTDANKQNLQSVYAYVLTKDASEEDERHVLVEENFSPSLKIEWPHYIKAKKVAEADEDGYTEKEIAETFGWPKAKVRETLIINEIIQDFLMYAMAPKDQNDAENGGAGLAEIEAETIAANNYQYFNEAKKSLLDALKTKYDFKLQFYKWIIEDKFSSFHEVRIASRAWEDPEAKAALMSKDPAAAKSAKAILDYKTRVVKTSDEVIGRIESFIKFLNEMTTADKKLIPEKTRKDLAEALELVTKMSGAVAR